jgi:hypothetical protein
MPRTVVILAAAFLSASCLEVVDVVQPLEVETGSTFEVALLVRAAAPARTRGPVFGVLAVSLPEGAVAKEGSFRGGAQGKLRRLEGVGAASPSERPGCGWTFFRTRDPYEPSKLAAGVFDVKLKVKADTAPGDYRFTYAAAAVPAARDGGPDLSRLEWPEGTLARWITVK